MRPRYPTGDEIHAGDRIVFQGQRAHVLFVKRVNDFTVDVSPSDWDFVSDDTISEDGRCMNYDGFCAHDGIVLLSRSGAA